MQIDTSLLYPVSCEKISDKFQNWCPPHFLISQNLTIKNQMDDFLNFSKEDSSRRLSASSKTLEKKKIKAISEKKLQNDSLKEAETIRQIFDKEGRLIQLISQDQSVDYRLSYEENITKIVNQVTGEVHIQEMDDQGHLIREVFPCGLEIFQNFNKDLLSEVTLPDQSKMIYQYIDQDLINVQRLNSEGDLLYQQGYEAKGDYFSKELLIGEIGSYEKSYEQTPKTLISESDYLYVKNQNNEEQSFISKTLRDSIGEQISKTLDDAPVEFPAEENTPLNKREKVVCYNGFICSYDEKGRLIKKKSDHQRVHFGYDAFDRLISVDLEGKKVEYTYDLEGRRLSKKVSLNGKMHQEFYLYQGQNQIGIYNEKKEPVHLRILGTTFHTHLPFAVAIEAEGKVYVPIYNSNCNILQLIDYETKEIVDYASLDPFAENLQDLKPICPWIFATKHFDYDTGLIDFGDRQYDPSIKQWISLDPDPKVLEELL